MAFIFKGYRPRIAIRMAAGDKELDKWLMTATFAKASTGHYLAWHPDTPDQMAVLPPGHPSDKPCVQIESWEPGSKIEDLIEYVESGEFDRRPPGVLNLFIKDPETGDWK